MKLHKISKKYNIYISEELDESKNPAIYFREKKIYYRFMDTLYIPKPVYKLSTDFVIELNNIRDKYCNKVVDIPYNELIYKQTTHSVAKLLNVPSQILDFGCGKGSAFSWIDSVFPVAKVYGFDIRDIKPSKNYFKTNTGSINQRFPYPDNFFSVVFAFFVFHFFISDTQIEELRRIIKGDGFLAFNLINSSDFSIIDRLQRAGFSMIKPINFQTDKNSGVGSVFFVSKR
jgi:SAM-dependent methyltransferase